MQQAEKSTVHSYRGISWTRPLLKEISKGKRAAKPFTTRGIHSLSVNIPGMILLEKCLRKDKVYSSEETGASYLDRSRPVRE